MDDHNQKRSSIPEHASEACIFCKIIKGEIPSAKVYEDEKVFAFLDIAPIQKGHTLVIPKEHAKDIHSVSEESVQNIGVALKKVADAVKNGTGCGGINIMQSNGLAAGQAVWHLHFHIIPRFDDDGLPMWPQGKYEKGEMAEFQQKIASRL